MISSLYVAVPLLATLALLQSAVLSRLPLGGLQILLLVVIARAMMEGMPEGLLWAFVGGIWLDLLSLSPVGGTSLAYMSTVVAIVLVQRNLPQSPLVLPLLLAPLGTAVYFFVSLSILSLLGFPVNWQATGVTPALLGHTIAILPLYWLMMSLRRLWRPRRVEI
jgi:cell shape-determining protein MreD